MSVDKIKVISEAYTSMLLKERRQADYSVSWTFPRSGNLAEYVKDAETMAREERINIVDMEVDRRERKATAYFATNDEAESFASGISFDDLSISFPTIRGAGEQGDLFSTNYRVRFTPTITNVKKLEKEIQLYTDEEKIEYDEIKVSRGRVEAFFEDERIANIFADVMDMAGISKRYPKVTVV